MKQFFEQCPETAIAFSGGVDSAYLLYAAAKFGKRVKAYYVNTAFQPQFELDDAKQLARELGAEMEVLDVNILCHAVVAANPADRCYHCKKILFSKIIEAAKRDGFDVLLDGTNASDDSADRPGMRALAELKVRSPLRECGLTKTQIRELSREAGLFTHDKPAYACLATRIPTGEAITAEKLQRTERSEAYLTDLGFRDFRVRTLGEAAKLQVRGADMPLLMACREEIINELKQYYAAIWLDLEARK